MENALTGHLAAREAIAGQHVDHDAGASTRMRELATKALALTQEVLAARTLR